MKRIYGLLCAAAVGLSGIAAVLPATIAVSAEEAETGGSCGENVTWEYDAETGRLTVSGTGTMDDWFLEQTPWIAYQAEIREAVIESGVTNIGANAFHSCENLKSVTLPAGVTSVGEMAFSGCIRLSELTLPEGLTYIGRFAISGCRALTSIVIPEGVTKIDESAFYGCETLADITIPESVTEIGMMAFDQTAWLTARQKENPLVIVNDILADGRACTGTAVIPEGVTKIADLAFWRGKVSGVTFPASLREIGRSAFHSCKALRSVTVPAAVTSMGGSVFMGCSSITSVTLEDGVTSIANSEFQECKALKSITIPESVTRIGDYAFGYCEALESVSIPESAAEIGARALVGTPWLTARQEETPLVIVNDNLLDGTACTGEAVIPESVKVICGQAFHNALEVTSIRVPEGIARLDRYTFGNCQKLQSIQLPESLTEIGNGVFESCENLAAITLPEHLQRIGIAAFSRCKSLAEITVPASVASIGNSAFSDCAGLKVITVLNPDCDIYGSPTTINNNESFWDPVAEAGMDVPVLEQSAESETDEPAFTEPGWQYTFTGVIRGYDNSTAQAYAEKYGYAFESLGTYKYTQTLSGDTDCSGVVDVSDAVILARYLTEDSTAQITDQGLANADADGSGKVDTEDVVRIVKIVAKLV